MFPQPLWSIQTPSPLQELGGPCNHWLPGAPSCLPAAGLTCRSLLGTKRPSQAPPFPQACLPNSQQRGDFQRNCSLHTETLPVTGGRARDSSCGIDSLSWEWPPSCLTPRHHGQHIWNPAQGTTEGSSGTGQGWGQEARSWGSKQLKAHPKEVIGGRTKQKLRLQAFSACSVVPLDVSSKMLRDKMIKNQDSGCRALEPNVKLLWVQGPG